MGRMGPACGFRSEKLLGHVRTTVELGAEAEGRTAGPPVLVPVWWRAGVQPGRASDAAKYLAACLQLQVQRRPQLSILISAIELQKQDKGMVAFLWKCEKTSRTRAQRVDDHDL
ncbi:hypothetical protein AAC387_Pa02g0838 [Persea americana]